MPAAVGAAVGAPVGAPVGVCSAFALFCAAHTNARTPATAVNQTIFFPSTVKSSIPQNELETLGWPRLIVNSVYPWRFAEFCRFLSSPLFPFSSLPRNRRRRRVTSFMSANKVIRVGRVGSDPESRLPGGGQTIEVGSEIPAHTTHENDFIHRHKRIP